MRYVEWLLVVCEVLMMGRLVLQGYYFWLNVKQKLKNNIRPDNLIIIKVSYHQCHK